MCSGRSSLVTCPLLNNFVGWKVFFHKSWQAHRLWLSVKFSGILTIINSLLLVGVKLIYQKVFIKFGQILIKVLNCTMLSLLLVTILHDRLTNSSCANFSLGSKLLEANPVILGAFQQLETLRVIEKLELRPHTLSCHSMSATDKWKKGLEIPELSSGLHLLNPCKHWELQ